MNRLIALALLVLAPAVCVPAAHAQVTAEERAMAAAFSQTDLDTLGECQARVEGAGVLLRDMEPWLVAQNQTDVLGSLRTQVEAGASVIENFSEVRRDASKAKGMNLKSSDAAHARMLETFKRFPGEDERGLYTRAHAATRLPQPCRDALKRGRYKVGVEGLGSAG